MQFSSFKNLNIEYKELYNLTNLQLMLNILLIDFLLGLSSFQVFI